MVIQIDRQDPAAKPASSLSGGMEYRNLGMAELVEHAIRREEGRLSDSGALAVYTGEHTGRSPKDKYVVHHGEMAGDIWWGSVNQPLSPESFARLHGDVIAHLGQSDRYSVDLSVASHPAFNLPVRVTTSSAWSALFACHLFLPARTEQAHSHDGWTVLHAPDYAANPERHGTRSSTAIAIDFEWRRVVICGTWYAGEIKKAMFTVLQGTLPARGVATMHCSANEGPDGDTALFFGLSGTGKTTLSTVPGRRLVGDDEHGWCDSGIFNFEGGCYAKTIGLSRESEPEIYGAVRHFGTVLENVVLDDRSRKPRFDDDSLTENTRAAYPLAYLDPRAGGEGAHPRAVIFLTADAFGVLPPAARLSPEQALYWYLTGYTSKLAGTERGVTTPSATFSACFASPFLPLPPVRYAELLGDKIRQHQPEIWLVNTGWTGGAYGVGERFPIAATRSIVQAILDGSLAARPADVDPVFGFLVPRSVPGLSPAQAQPRMAWSDPDAFDQALAGLVRDMADNFALFADVDPAIRAAGPRLD